MDGNITYRELAEADYDTAVEYLHYAFYAGDDDDVDFSALESMLQKDAFVPYGFYREDTLLAVMAELPIKMRVRGEIHEAMGITFLATAPEFRRKGVFSTGFSDLLELHRDRGTEFVVGRPFKQGAYDRLGFTMTTEYVSVTCGPAQLLGAVSERKGEFQRLDIEDWGEIAALYERFSDHPLAFDRDETYWKGVVLTYMGDTHFMAVWKRGDEIRGYVVYQLIDLDGQTMLREIDMGYLDYEALGHLLYYMGNHDSQVSKVRFNMPTDVPLFSLVGREGISYKLQPGHVVRTVNVRRILENISYPDDLSGEVTFEVNDEIAPWNDDVFRLQLDAGSPTCTVTDEDPTARMDVNAFTQLLTGYHDTETLEQLGKLSVEDESTRTFLERNFPERNTFIRDEI